MISLYSGTPGSGKSLHVAERIFTKLSAGRPVIANFPVAVEKIRHRRADFLELDNDELEPGKLISFSDTYFRKHRFSEDRILLVIDEAQLLFNAREWSQQGRKEWLSFFTQHRKYGYEIILVAQFDRMLDRQIRSLLEYEVIHRKVSNFGIWGKMLALWTLGKLFVGVKLWYPLREKVGAEWFVMRKKYYSLYDSYRRFDSDPVQAAAAPRQDDNKMQSSGSLRSESVAAPMNNETPAHSERSGDLHAPCVAPAAASHNVAL